MGRHDGSRMRGLRTEGVDTVAFGRSASTIRGRHVASFGRVTPIEASGILRPWTEDSRGQPVCRIEAVRQSLQLRGDPGRSVDEKSARRCPIACEDRPAADRLVDWGLERRDCQRSQSTCVRGQFVGDSSARRCVQHSKSGLRAVFCGRRQVRLTSTERGYTDSRRVPDRTV